MYHDLLGMMSHPHHAKVTPKFCKQYASVGKAIQSALSQYREEVSSGAFPSTAFSPYRQGWLAGTAGPCEGNTVRAPALIRPLQAGCAAYRPCGHSMHLRSLVLALWTVKSLCRFSRCALIPNLKITQKSSASCSDSCCAFVFLSLSLRCLL